MRWLRQADVRVDLGGEGRWEDGKGRKTWWTVGGRI